MFIVLLVGGVHGANLALDGTPTFTHSSGGDNTCGGCPYGVGWEDNPLYLNDNNINNPIGVCISVFQGTYSGTYTSIINLENINNKIDEVEYVGWGSAYGQSGTIAASLYYDGGWHGIDSRSINMGGANPDPQTVNINSGGPWYDVERIKLYTTLQAQQYYCVQSYLYEISVTGTFCGDGVCNGDEDCNDCVSDCGCIGDEICFEAVCCTPQSCTDLGQSCGFWDDGCGGTVDCGSCVDLTDAYWASMNNDIATITQADLNDRVQLRVKGSDMENKQIDYEIWKEGEVSWNPLDWFDRKITETETTGFTSWRTSEEGNYYFKAEIVDTGDVKQSGNLEVLIIEDNSPPYVEIVNPKTTDIYYTNEVIDFRQISWDEDDEYTTLWNFGDGGTSSEFNTSHVYTTVGQKTITLVAIDERGAVAEDKVSILIIDSNADNEYVFAHIDKPEWGESFLGKTIPFNASSSYAINATNCNGVSCIISCTAGRCPLNTHEGGVIINDDGKRGDYSEFDCLWNFNEGTIYDMSGIDGILFNWTFNTAGKHTALLTVSKNPESSMGVEFSNFLDYPKSEGEETVDLLRKLSLLKFLSLIFIILFILIIWRILKKKRKIKTKRRK